ncbi:uridine 5'-monophosphate synthase [Tetranychus urticae]|uniref:Uridine 5'-monophosphate synthase n=1 Tax=Tetranychus urticae TaxID=32264 RepID=T1KCS8_TETUR|nr:uridine 5'-monophosphate synthase [Tetranychus urticae]
MKILTQTELIDELYKIGAIKIEDIILKSGDLSPIYIDLRLVVGHPDLLRSMSKLMWSMVQDLEFDLICGVPLTAIPFAVVMSVDNNIPMVMRRSSPKTYGTKKLIEGKFQAGQKVLVVEDVITSGSSIMETVQSLKSVGLEIEHASIFVDRGQKGFENLENNGVKVRSVLKMSDILARLMDNGIIKSEEKARIQKWLRETESKIDIEPCS